MVRWLPQAVRIGLALILFAIICPAGFSWWESTFIWVPLDMPIALSRGHVRTPRFRINVAASYAIAVEGDWNDLGLPCFVGPRCATTDDRNPLAVSWSLFNGKRVVVSGDSTRNGRVWYQTSLGAFYAGKGQYFLDIDLWQDGSRFNSRSPRLVVSESGSVQSEVGTWLGRAFFMSLLAAVAGIFLLIHSAVEWRREKRASRARELSLTQPGPQPRRLQMSPNPSPPDLQAGFQSRLAIWTGAFLVLSGAAGYLSVYHWRAIKIFVPVNMPVSLRAGHIHTGPFRINMPDYYSIWLDGDYHSYRAHCGESYPAPKARWTLYRDGAVADRSEEPTYPDTYLPMAHLAREGIYDLDVEILYDAHCLDFAHPRLRVFANSREYDDFASRLLWLCAAGIGAGATLLVMAGGRSLRKSPAPVAPSVEPGTPYGRVRWKPKPSKRLFSGVSSFGLVAALLYLLTFIVMWVNAIHITRRPCRLTCPPLEAGDLRHGDPGLAASADRRSGDQPCGSAPALYRFAARAVE